MRQQSTSLSKNPKWEVKIRQIKVIHLYIKRWYWNMWVYVCKQSKQKPLSAMQNLQIGYCLELAKGGTTPWWRHQMEAFSALLAICAGNSPVTGEFPAQRPVTWSFDVFSLIYAWSNRRFSKQWWGCWFETPSHSLWRHCNAQRQAVIPHGTDRSSTMHTLQIYRQITNSSIF